MAKVHVVLTAAGFYVEQMGGGCEAYRRDLGEGYELITLADDASIPTATTDNCLVGYYENEEDSEGTMLEAPFRDIARILPTLRPDVPLKVALMATYALGD